MAGPDRFVGLDLKPPKPEKKSIASSVLLPSAKRLGVNQDVHGFVCTTCVCLSVCLCCT